MSDWLRTPDASTALAKSPDWLKRARDTHGGFLEAGRHYINGTSRNSSITWNVPLIRKELIRRAISPRS